MPTRILRVRIHHLLSYVPLRSESAVGRFERSDGGVSIDGDIPVDGHPLSTAAHLEKGDPRMGARDQLELDSPELTQWDHYATSR